MGFKIGIGKKDIANDIVVELDIENAQERFFLWEQFMKMNKKSLSCLHHHLMDKVNNIQTSTAVKNEMIEMMLHNEYNSSAFIQTPYEDSTPPEKWLSERRKEYRKVASEKLLKE